MDVRNSAMVVVLYLAGAAIVIGVGAAYFAWYWPTGRPLAMSNS